VKDKYSAFASRPEGHFPYPIGAASALSLGYDRAMVGRIPSRVAERFVGVGNPFVVAGIRHGQRVLDVGCGCGFDVMVAAQMVGEGGSVVGVDVTRAMVELARVGVGEVAGLSGFGRMEIVEASGEMLPFGEGEFDAVISNGVMNLVPDKERAFGQLYRVLKPGGVCAFADLLLDEGADAGPVDDPAAWAT